MKGNKRKDFFMKPFKDHYEVVIIGGGLAGMGAAISAPTVFLGFSEDALSWNTI